MDTIKGLILSGYRARLLGSLSIPPHPLNPVCGVWTVAHSLLELMSGALEGSLDDLPPTLLQDIEASHLLVPVLLRHCGQQRAHEVSQQNHRQKTQLHYVYNSTAKYPPLSQHIMLSGLCLCLWFYQRGLF